MMFIKSKDVIYVNFLLPERSLWDIGTYRIKLYFVILILFHKTIDYTIKFGFLIFTSCRHLYC